jgi:uncharacterized protein YkwD
MTTTEFDRRALLKWAGLSLAAGLTGTLAGCATPPSPVTSGSARDHSAPAVAMLNTLRARKGLPPVTVDRAAAGAAVHQARRMASAAKMAHLIGLGDDFKSRMKGDGVALPAAENVAAGQDTLEAAMQAWIDSPKHLHNMLGSYRGLGVAVAYDAGNGNRPYWAMVLSNPG